MSDRWKAFWLGIFIIAAMGLAAWLILFIKPSVGDGRVMLRVRFSNIEKIAEGTLVTFAGKQVGEVYEIREIENPRLAPADPDNNLFMYELLLKVDSSVRVFIYDEIIFATAGLLGEKSIAIVPKATPPGAPPAHEVTGEILYARSTDRLEQTMNKLVNVAETFQGTLQEVNHFIETNKKEFNTALHSVSFAAEEMQKFLVHTSEKDIVHKAAQAITRADTFFSQAQEHQLIERLGYSFDSLHTAAALFTQGEGTISRLANSDCLYVQLTTVLCQMQTILQDMKNFGILYQFDRKWQRTKDLRRRCTEIP